MKIIMILSFCSSQNKTAAEWRSRTKRRQSIAQFLYNYFSISCFLKSFPTVLSSPLVLRLLLTSRVSCLMSDRVMASP